MAGVSLSCGSSWMNSPAVVSGTGVPGGSSRLTWMSSRRLNSDRFLAGDFSPAVYTVPGMRWLTDNTMASVILRHYPQLRPAMRSVPNAFLPWQRPGVRG